MRSLLLVSVLLLVACGSPSSVKDRTGDVVCVPSIGLSYVIQSQNRYGSYYTGYTASGSRVTFPASQIKECEDGS